MRSKALERIDRDIEEVKQGRVPVFSSRGGRKDWPLRFIQIPIAGGAGQEDGKAEL